MKHLVFLDRGAGELEKILSGIKTMLIKDIAPAQPTPQPISLGDRLYFLRDFEECDLRVTATVLRVLPIRNDLGGDLPQILKEMQPKLQLNEDQYNHWSARKQVLLVEFNSAHKISVINIDRNKIAQTFGWIAFEEFSQPT